MNDNGNYTLDDVKLDENEITFEQWESKYKPVINHLDKYSTPDMPVRAFETYGEEYEHVIAQDPRYVWTEVQADFCMLLVPGIALVNRLAYFVCEEPWTDENESVVISMDIECHCYDEAEEEGEGDPECPDCEGYGFRAVYLDSPEVKLYHEENA